LASLIRSRIRVWVLLAGIGGESPFVPGSFPLWPLIAALPAGRTSEFFPGGRPRPRLGGGASRETGLRGRPRVRLAFATTFALRVFFALGLGGRPRFLGFRAVALAGFLERPEVFDFCAKTIVLLSDRRNSRIRASLACLPVVKTPARGPAKTVKSRRVARAGQPPVFQAPPLRSRPGPAVASDFPAPECATQRFPSATQSLHQR